MKDPSDQLYIYQTLHLLLEEEDPDTFQQLLESFTESWKTKEAKFISYFQAQYAKRTGFNYTQFICMPMPFT